MSDKIEYQSQSRLGETDKLLMKLDLIINSIKGKDDYGIEFDKVKDEFDKARYKINQQFSETEVYLGKRDELSKSTAPKDIKDRLDYQNKVQVILDFIQPQLKDLEITLKAQKNKPKKYGDISHKEEIKALMDERFQILRSRLEGVPVPEKEIKDNRTHLEKLEELLNERKGEQYQDRELYQEEKDKMDQWNAEIEDQNKGLEGVHTAVKVLKNEVKVAGKHIDTIGKKTQQLNKDAEKTQVKLETQNKKLKELLAKLRTGDRICIDIILICVCLGLIAILYNIIKTKFFNNSSSTSSSSAKNTTKLFLLD